MTDKDASRIIAALAERPGLRLAVLIVKTPAGQLEAHGFAPQDLTPADLESARFSLAQAAERLAAASTP